MQNILPSQNIEPIMHKDPAYESPGPITPSGTSEQGENKSSTQPSSHIDLLPPYLKRMSFSTATRSPKHNFDFLFL